MPDPREPHRPPETSGARLFDGMGALVTGAASSIGRAAAVRLAQEGADVVLTDLHDSAGEAVARSLCEAGLRARFLACDLADRAQAGALAARTIEALGRVTLFVHSASPRRSEADTLFTVDDTTFDRMLDVNVRAGFVLGRDLAAHMIASGTPGRMGYLTSQHRHAPRNLPHYSAAKAAEMMLVKELARSLGPRGIRVNAVAPGVVLGGGFTPAQADLEAIAGKIALGRTGTPDEVAQVVAMLLTDRFTSYVTGATIEVDGGLALFNWIPAAPA